MAYIDGTFKKEGILAKGQTIPNGALVLGQELDAHIGGFDSEQAFQGNLTKVNIWDRVFSRNETTSLYQEGLCSRRQGNVIGWDDLKVKRSGAIQVKKHPCQA